MTTHLNSLNPIYTTSGVFYFKQLKTILYYLNKPWRDTTWKVLKHWRKFTHGSTKLLMRNGHDTHANQEMDY